MTEGIASKTLISSEGMGVGNGSSTGELVAKFTTGNEGEEWQVRERSNGMLGAEGVSSRSGLSEREKEISPSAVRRSTNKREMLGETPACFII